jgi:hypothetical protein
VTNPAILPRTVCGLWVVAGDDPRDRSNFSWHTVVLDEPGGGDVAVAREFARLELLSQVGTAVRTGEYVMPSEIAFGPQHPGHVAREQFWLDESDVLVNADPEVPGWLVEDDDHTVLDDLNSYTVCGILQQSTRPVCWAVAASNPLAAYYRAWSTLSQQTGEHLLLCAVHRGSTTAL